MPTEQCNESCEHKARSDRRIALLADRLAIALVILKSRHGADWLPWFSEACWDAEDSLGDEVREWTDYKAAKDIVRLFIKREEKRYEQSRKESAQREAQETAQGSDMGGRGGVAEE